MWRTRSTDASGSAARMNSISLVQAWPYRWATAQMAQLCSLMHHHPRRQLLGRGEISVLVEDPGQFLDLGPQSLLPGQTGLGIGDAVLASLGEQVVQHAGVG